MTLDRYTYQRICITIYVVAMLRLYQVESYLETKKTQIASRFSLKYHCPYCGSTTAHSPRCLFCGKTPSQASHAHRLGNTIKNQNTLSPPTS